MFRSVAILAEMRTGTRALRIDYRNFGSTGQHRRSLHRSRRTAKENGWTPPSPRSHPTQVVAPPRRHALSTPAQRIELMTPRYEQSAYCLRHASPSYLRSDLQTLLFGEVAFQSRMAAPNVRSATLRCSGDTALLQIWAKHTVSLTEIIWWTIELRGLLVSSSEVRPPRRQALCHGVRYCAGPTCTGRSRPLHGIGSKQTVPSIKPRPKAEILPGHRRYITRTTDLDGGRSVAIHH